MRVTETRTARGARPLPHTAVRCGPTVAHVRATLTDSPSAAATRGTVVPVWLLGGAVGECTAHSSPSTMVRTVRVRERAV